MISKSYRLVACTSFLATALLSTSGATSQAASCGGETSCDIESGQYFIHMPEDRQGEAPLGAIFYLHGYRGKAVNAIRNKSFQRMADELGVAFVAVQGLQGFWSFPTGPSNLRDESQFFDDILDDLANRFGVDKERTLLSGFSAGGFMTWYQACADSGKFSGYAPIAGAFWKPLPEECPTAPPYLFHVHGTTDTVVPLAGRPLGGGRWHQGDVFKSFDVWRKQNGLGDTEPRKLSDGNLECERWTPETGLLELCLHDGGHSVQAKWIKRAWNELGDMKGWNDKG